MKIITTAALLLVVLLVGAVFSQNNQDHKVTSLPGYDKNISFNTYTGYLTANATRGHYLFYWLVESQGNPKTDPVVFWTNGGPGCSSLGGMTSEHGPFLVGVPTNGKKYTLVDNQYSWNKKANMIYVEQPIGVGFSYSDNTVDYRSVSDDSATQDFANAIRDFFNHYPQFLNNDVYISGESYGGVYVPITAYHVMDGNAAGQQPKVNLKGILVGNGVTDGEADSNSIPPYLKEHSILTEEQYARGFNACHGNFYRYQNLPKCSSFLDETQSIFGVLNPYYLYDSCVWTGVNGAVGSVEKSSVTKKMYLPKRGRNHPLFEMYRHRPQSTKRVSTHIATLKSTGKVGAEYDAPCVSDGYIVKYFNYPEVQQALGVRRKPVDPEGWLVCTNGPLNYDSIYDSILPFYQKLLPNIRILVYTGDVDAVVNSLGTQRAIAKLNLRVASGFGDSWKQWTHKTTDGTIADGYYRKFVDGKGLTFVTVRGAGHMVPEYKPEAGFLMFSRFLDDQF
ncbi:hypothetical protein ABK040_011858 [Willaertia magna]